ncbi:MAG TPA: S4 domain-containing protein, partial [Patescibacteria group bacterium]|nr:S4 domain-containing protein [Patescibacteria group bacterium]
DEMIIPGFEICTRLSPEEIKSIQQKISHGENPMTFKRQLAKLIVEWLTGSDAAQKAEEQFEQIHQKGETPEEMMEIKVKEKELALADALVLAKLVGSKSEARRQIEQGGIKVDEMKVTDVNARVSISKNGVLIQKGKRFFVKLSL